MPQRQRHNPQSAPRPQTIHCRVILSERARSSATQRNATQRTVQVSRLKSAPYNEALPFIFAACTAHAKKTTTIAADLLANHPSKQRPAKSATGMVWQPYNGDGMSTESREIAMNENTRGSRGDAADHRLPKTTVGAAVFLALYGLPHAVFAQQTSAAASGELEEVTVTANRRQQSVEEVPYSLSVVSAEQLERTGVTDIASLASQVPGLSLYDYGARLTGATTPIIRGINATSEPRGFRTFEQNPVGTYVGNSPMSGYFQLDDLKQVEVLRGPQGTLYGAGALGGALRFIP